MGTTKIGDMSASRNTRGRVTYQVEMWHEGLAKHRVIRGDTIELVEHKARLQSEAWDRRWASASAKEDERSQRREERLNALLQRDEAEERTREAEEELENLRDILVGRLADDVRVEWESMKDRTELPEPEPVAPRPREAPMKRFLRDQPERASYQPRLGLLDKLITSRRQKRHAEAEARYRSDLQQWDNDRSRIELEYTMALEAHAEAVSRADNAHKVVHDDWVSKRDAWHAQQSEQHRSVDAERLAYLAKDPQVILDYCSRVLEESPYPESINFSVELDYDPTSRALLIEAKLPAPDHLPTLKSVKYVAARDEFNEAHISEAERLRLYDAVLYQITLRALYEVFNTDEADAIDTVVLNGIVESIDPKTGREISPCVLSIRAAKVEFVQINLAQVEPKACFKALKGVGSSKLSGLAAVAPVMQWNRHDKRFVASHGVADTLDDGVNLAAMDWEDFEHLIREVFEKEFSGNGGEVKVTQSSRDGGVDAVAFDPDPIRGGKIIIQAKCYTNTVGVSAVRDLYGTVMNEGAIKGVLVTTSDFGPDSYDFAMGKPLALLNGSNLLAMLEKHNHKAKIDINDAKRLKKLA